MSTLRERKRAIKRADDLVRSGNPWVRRLQTADALRGPQVGRLEIDPERPDGPGRVEPLVLGRGIQTCLNLNRLIETISRSGDPDEEFFYLGGPMTGIPKFNFPRFHEVAFTLRSKEMNIISPAELDDPSTEAAALASEDGAPGSGAAHGQAYEDFLSRDIIVCALPTCVGGIFLEGWHTSRGARGESWILAYLNKQVLEYHEDEQGAPVLVQVDRDEQLAHLGVPSYARGSVPRDKPGVLTVKENGD